MLQNYGFLERIIDLLLRQIVTCMPEPVLNSSINPLAPDYNPWTLLVITFVLVMVGFQFVGSFLGLAVALPFYEGSLMNFIEDLQNPSQNSGMRVPLLLMQGVASVTGFIVMPFLLFKYYFHTQISGLYKRSFEPRAIILAMLIVPVFMGVNAPFIEWNQNFIFPEAFAGLEAKLKAMEELLAETSTFITNFDSVGQLLLGLVVVAVIPGIGEEFVFRGLIQNHLFRITGNVHSAIWLAGLLFSLFHLQFYGLVPRMMLGAMFGYLYYFSGSLVYPMIAHFVNNGFTLVMLYLYNIGQIEFDIEATETLPWTQVLISVLVTGILMVAFRRSFNLYSVDEKLG
jgi:membrane protease YdiL (CAAX protease family)